MTILQLLKYLGYAMDVIEQIGRIIDLTKKVTLEDMNDITARMDEADADFDALIARKQAEAAAEEE